MIRFRYEPTLRDYLRLQQVVIVRQFKYLFVLATLLFCLFVASPFIMRANSHREIGLWEAYRGSLGVLFLPGVVVFLVVAIYLGARKRWNNVGELREPREYELDNTGLRVTGSSLSGYLDWKHFTEAYTKSGFFFLKTGQNQYHYFPVAVVPDKAALTAMLREKVRRPARKGWRISLWVWLALVGLVLILLFLR